MEAKITKAFPGVPDGEVYPRTIEVGETVTGELAAAAIAAGFAEAPTKEKPKEQNRRPADGGKP